MEQTNVCDDMMRSFNTIVKCGGSFKSVKQRDFLMKTCREYGFAEPKVQAWVKDLVLEEGQTALVIESRVRWADYGNRSVRRYGFLYVVDVYGVVSRHKLRFNYDDATKYSYPNPDKAELEFTRQSVSDEIKEGVEKAAIQAAERDAANAQKKHIGSVGEKITARMTLKRISKSYSNYGITTTYIFNDVDGNDIVWFSSRDIGIEEGKEYEITATVKAHQTYKDVASTVITRAKAK